MQQTSSFPRRYLLTLCLGTFVPLCLVLISGCGYRNVYRTPARFSIYCPFLTNLTMQPGVEVPMTGAITRELLRSGVTLEKEDQADFLLAGQVTSFRRKPLSFRSDDQKAVSQYQLNITVHLEVSPGGAAAAVRPSAKASATDLTVSADYYLTGPFAQSETEALNAAAEDLAKRAAEWVAEILP